MPLHTTIHRYILEIELISESKYPSFKKIKNYLSENDFNISDRTLQRHLMLIRNEFFVEILYNKEQGGYYIDYENSFDINTFFNFLKLVNTADILTQSFKESKNNLKFIDFDNGAGLKGIKNLKPLLFAINQNRKISFSYNNFYLKKNRNFTISPYLLKEYHNRWYIVGRVSGYEDLRCFGIDRIDNLKITTDKFTKDDNFNPKELYSQTIGLTYSEHKPEIIILSFTSFQGNYIKTLPLHSSQKVLIDDEDEFRISIEVCPNFELTQQILKYGNSVKVIKPTWLAKEIKTILIKTLEKYDE